MLKNIIMTPPFPPRFPIPGQLSILKVIGKVVKWIYDKFVKYDPKTATIDDTKNINEMLEKCLEHYRPEAKKFDEIFMSYANQQISEVIRVLKEVNQESEIINESLLLQLEYQKNMTFETLKHAHSKKIDDIFSLNNNELLDILKLEDNTGREEGLKKLTLKGLEKANIDSIEELEEVLKYQEKIIFREIERNNNLLEEQLKGELREVEEIQAIIQENKGEILKKKVYYSSILMKLGKLEIE